MKNKIREARESCGLTQAKLAEQLGINDVTLSGYELGKHDPKSDTLVKIARICHVTVDFLLGREDEAEAPLSAEALAFARAYDKMSAYGKAIVGTVMEQEEIHKGAKRLRVLPTVHDSDLYARYLSKREAEEVDSDETDIIAHRYD